MSDLIGKRLNQYELREVVRRGGMSTVFKAYQESLDRFVAVKVLFTGRDPQFAARFKREARAIAALQHHNILPVYDYGEEEGLLYLVLQYIENGATLADMLGRPMEPTQALRLTGHVLDALDYAHKRGIIHRDIKPANVLMPSPNWPMLADFGIAKLMNDNQVRLTLANQIIGTAAYMAPEQATGRPIDARTDLYAAGAVIYELVTGRVPFDADTPMAVLTKHVYEPPPPARSLNPDIPIPIEAVLQRALEKDPGARFQTAEEMAEELRRVANQLEHDPKRSQMTGLYQVGLRAFEQGHWDEAVERLRQVITIDPEFEDASEMLDAARDAQERSREDARQRINQVRQRGATAENAPVQPQRADPNRSILKTTKLPELDLPPPAPAPVQQAAQPAARPVTRPLPPTTQPLENNEGASRAPAKPIVAPASDEPVAPQALPVAWIVAAVVILVLVVALFFILTAGRRGATGGATPPAAGSAATAGTGANVGQEPTVGTANQAPPDTNGNAGGNGGVTLAPPAGTLVLQDNFDNKTEPPSALEDNLRVTDLSRGFHPPGVYHIIPRQPNTSFWVVSPRYLLSNFTLQVKIWDDSDDFTGDFFEGVIFRARDTQQFYALLLDLRAGKYSVSKYAADGITELVPWSPSSLLKLRADPNLVRVDGAGNAFTFFVNDQELGRFSDDTYPSGMVGLISSNVNAIEPHPHFDDWKLWSNDPPPAASALPAERADENGDMVLVMGGDFIMGGNEKSDAQTHVVKVSDFYIDKTEVTNAAYRACVGTGDCTPPREPSSETHPDYFTNSDFDNFPVVKVSYEQARTFCGSLGKRLPTEAEWEKAASWDSRQSAKVAFPFGMTFDQAQLNSAESGMGDAVAVGSFGTEINGTVDMGGNVSEWVNSLDMPYPYNELDGRDEYPAAGNRIFRGGSWAQTAGKAKTFDRRSAAPDFTDREIGFRCALTAS